MVLTVVMYGMTVSYGFYYDDYHFIHPYTLAEVLRAFRAPWDASGIETPYYRPLTICFYAARFWLFGLNSTACHVLSLIMFAAAATLFATFAMRAIGGLLAGLIAVAIFVVHPGMPYSAVAWVTNQMHLMQLIVVLTAFLYWFAVRNRPANWWMPILALQAIALLIKEDGVMLIPAILALHTLRKYTAERELPQVPWRFLVAAALLFVSLLLVRSWALEGTRSPGIPGFDQAWTNLQRGFWGPFRLVPARRPWQSGASWFATLLPLVALVFWRRLPAGARFGLLAGIVLGGLFDLPFVFIIKAEQLHLVTMSASLAFAASVAGVLYVCRGHAALRVAAATVAAGGLVAMAAVARDIARDFEPFGHNIALTDRIVGEWAAVPVELREYLALKSAPAPRSALDSNPVTALDLVAFGLHGRETTPDGISIRWMAGTRADVYISRRERLITIPLRHEIGAFREPARVRITADGRPVDELVLQDGEWHPVSFTLRPRDTPVMSRMHRVQIELDRAWIPAQIIPGSSDTRSLGLHIGPVTTK